MMKFMFLFLVVGLINKSWLVMKVMFFLFYMFLVLFFPLYYQSNVFNYLILDNLSYTLVILSIWILGLMFMASEKLLFLNNYPILFSNVLIFLLMFLILSFCVNNFLLFYIFFEMSLIPTFLLIMGWGYQPERLRAGLYLLFYTLVASLPMLMGIFFLSQWNSVNFFFCLGNDSLFLYFSLILALMVKMPMFLVHLWLPKAHVEAPISGSMVLAGILLKLGGYGLVRVMSVLFNMNKLFSNWWISVSLFGGVLISLNCLRQIDLKSLIAYSSVAHMGLVLSGLMTSSVWGLNGALVMMIAHGLCSSGLFCLANITYERTHSRSIFLNKGLISVLPSLTLWWFLLSVSNMSSPPSLNLLGEINLINSVLSWSFFSMVLIFFLSFFSAAYCLYLYSYSQHGAMNSGIYSFMSSLIRENLLLVLHWAPLNFLFLVSELFLI